jgi:hypothetical protein
LGFEVFDVVSLVEYHVMPLFTSEYGLVRKNELIGGDDDIEGMLRVPSDSSLFAFLDGAIVAKHLEPRQELFEFHFPVEDHAGWDYD